MLFTIFSLFLLPFYQRPFADEQVSDTGIQGWNQNHKYCKQLILND